MKQIKMVVFDIDGTLLSAGKAKIEDSAVEAIHKLKAQGIKVLVATGRSMGFIKDHVKEVLDCDYYVTINGHCVLDRNKDIIIRHTISPDSVNRMLEFCQKNNIPMGLKTAHQMVVLNDYEGFYKHYSQGFDVRHLLLDDTQNHDYFIKVDAPLSIFLISPFEKVKPFMQDFPEFQFIGAGPVSMDVFGADINKTLGIEEILELNHLTWDNVMTFGDGDNDIDMTQRAAIGIAMGNATENMKAISNYVTLNVDEGGIAAALKHYNLI